MRKHETQKNMEILDLGNNVVIMMKCSLSPWNKLLKRKCNFRMPTTFHILAMKDQMKLKLNIRMNSCLVQRLQITIYRDENRDYESSPHGASLLKAKHDNRIGDKSNQVAVMS